MAIQLSILVYRAKNEPGARDQHWATMWAVGLLDHKKTPFPEPGQKVRGNQNELIRHSELSATMLPAALQSKGVQAVALQMPGLKSPLGTSCL